MMPPHFRDVAAAVATAKWRSTAKEHNSRKETRKFRDMLKKAGIPT
jgi:hypothetical protein